MPDYFYVSISAITIVGAALIFGAWINERKLKRTRDMYRDVDMKEWLGLEKKQNRMRAAL